jgi:hypothetical protein
MDPIWNKVTLSFLLKLSKIGKNCYAKNQIMVYNDAEGSFKQHFKTNVRSIVSNKFIKLNILN